MLIWIFGDVQKNVVHVLEHDRAGGFLQLKNANVRWFLSINENHIPAKVRESGQRTFRSIKVGGNEIEFSKGFEDLHTASYRKILQDDGFGLEDARKSVETVYEIRNGKIASAKNDYHPMSKTPLTKHPFERK